MISGNYDTAYLGRKIHQVGSFLGDIDILSRSFTQNLSSCGLARLNAVLRPPEGIQQSYLINGIFWKSIELAAVSNLNSN